MTSAASTSALMIRPPGPEPSIDDRSSSFSLAIRLATGDTLKRPSPAAGRPVGALAAGSRASAPPGGESGTLTTTAPAGSSAAAGSSVSAVTSGCAASSLRPVSIAGAGAAAPLPAEPTRSPISSSGSAITPMSAPTGTVSPACTRIFRRTPPPRASTSMLALSVSISATTSP